jgi:hypothetical protein
MTASRRVVCFINIGHAIDHMFVMRIGVRRMARDGWTRRNMMATFFLGIGAAAVATALPQ